MYVVWCVVSRRRLVPCAIRRLATIHYLLLERVRYIFSVIIFLIPKGVCYLRYIYVHLENRMFLAISVMHCCMQPTPSFYQKREALMKDGAPSLRFAVGGNGKAEALESM